MKKKDFDLLKPQEKYEIYTTRKKLFKIGKYVSIALPYIVILIAKFNDYFQTDGIKVGLGCIICLGLFVISMLSEVGKDMQKKLNGIIVMGILFAISWCFQSILTDITMILGYGLIGMVVGKFLDVFAENNDEFIQLYKEGIIDAEIKKDILKDVNKDEREGN